MTEKNEYDIPPQRLVWIQMGDNCLFCPDPKGRSYSTYIDLDSKMGYISCENCQEKMKAAVEFWRTHKAYGKANHLKDRTDLKIKRSSGAIEDGWRLNNPFLNFDDNGRIMIHCYNEAQDIGKWCYIDDVLELNNIL